MWHEIIGENGIGKFLQDVQFFHDSCIKEIKYVSGAYVDMDASMYPLNDKRILSVIIQRQEIENSTIELEFGELKYLKLFPIDNSFSCEIYEASLFVNDGLIYWTDRGGTLKDNIDDYDGTIICATTLRWRFVSCSSTEY